MSQMIGISVILALESGYGIDVFISYLIEMACVSDTNTPTFILSVNNSAYFCSGQSLYYSKYH